MTTQNEPKPMNLAVADEIPAGLDPIRREAYDWIVRFMAGHMTAADVDAMKVWYRQSPAHKLAYAEARRVWKSLGPIASESRRGTDEGDSIPITRGVRRPTPSMPSRRVFLGGAMAAAAASVAYVAVRPPLDLWPSYAEFLADFRTGAGERRQVVLAENVSLDLNTRTSIAVRAQSASATQIEVLAGEAAISTAASAPPLTVIAADGRVTTSDAELNLRCDGKQVSISCLKGRLELVRDGRSITLTGRQQVRYGTGGSETVAAFDPDNVTAWQHGVLTFDATPVDQVIAEINRYRPGRIILMNGDIGRRLLNARIRTAETDKIIVQIVHIFGAKARELPGGVVLLT
jgi:transmembrane sensor